MVIEDENGQQYKLKYIAHKTGLSAGWRNFAIAHKLLEGDVLVFQLVESTKFKVQILLFYVKILIILCSNFNYYHTFFLTY